MQWLRSHPYAAALLSAGLLLIVGTLIVFNRSGVAPEAGARVWSGGAPGFFNPVGDTGALQDPQENLYATVRNGPPFYYDPGRTPVPAPPSSADDLDFEALLSMLSSPSRTKPVDANRETGFDAYSFIPKGLISTSSPSRRSAAQQALYNYGNEAGGAIQTFEDMSRNSPQVLKNQFEDRRNPGKNAALLALAGGMRGVGRSLLSIEEVPSAVQAAHERLAQSYEEMGERLSKIPEAQTDEAMLQAMLSYNASVETFTKNFVALATLFSAYDVTFGSEDPGSVFTFTQSSF